ncbi:hypothetical protein WG78_17535 [Amantichitinum ursilacus]|uniref:Uncharacterized protein n=1 Tax=Amantichitinum ursilacus TaxID=857265 RepID=A0A0N0XGT7_9NEIS|nr:hypothetical protein WG78_17535 [Amantichitinum ursilacus]
MCRISRFYVARERRHLSTLAQIQSNQGLALSLTSDAFTRLAE